MVAVRDLVDLVHAIEGPAAEDDELVQRLARHRFVLIGESTHGTHEFYAERAAITQRLIAEHGFDGVVAEADFPDAWRVNCWVRGASDDDDAAAALAGFVRFPTWMWRNTVMVDFVNWLRDHNRRAGEGGDDGHGAGFYGMDLYSLFRSIEAVLGYLEGVDPEAAARARERYSCFDHVGTDSQAYGHAAAFGAGPSCEDDVVAQLAEVHATIADRIAHDGAQVEDAAFFAEQNALLVRDAEEYYRSMFTGRVNTWNLRDRHMVRSLDALADHIERQRGRPARLVVWAHNSHLGDARATEMGRAGELNVGQLVREHHGDAATLVGLTTSTGTVTAAHHWGGDARRMAIRPPGRGTYEADLDALGDRFWLDLHRPATADALAGPQLERAIGVVYRPDTERISHWFSSRLPTQFDVLLHYRHTTALTPLERSQEWEAGDAPETYPSGV